MNAISNMTHAEQAAAALAGLREQENEAAVHALAGEVRCVRRGDWHDRNANCTYCQFAAWTGWTPGGP